jgi:hypothetical protein
VDEHDDTVIDLAAYLRRKEAEAEGEDSPTTFTLWGGEGERARFALPLWRAAYLAGGRRAALLWLPKEVPDEEPEPLIVLDLREDQARLDFTPSSLVGLADATKPGSFAANNGGLAVYLGEDTDRKWYLTVDDLEGPSVDLQIRPQNDLLFLAGECAGLLFFRGLAVSVDGWEGNEGQ